MTQRLLIDDLAVGDRFSVQRKVSDDDVLASVNFAWDYGGYHVDQTFARAAGFRGVTTSGIFHVAMVASLAGHLNILGRELTVRFAGPIYAGDTLFGTAQIADLAKEKRQITLAIQVKNQDKADIVLADLVGYLPAPEWGVPKRPVSPVRRE